MVLSGKKLVLGVTGGVAAYKAAELLRMLIKSGAQVQVVMTEGAQQFITPLTMQALSGKPVFSGMWANDVQVQNGMPHIELSRNADAIVIAPCSAEFMAKLLHGRADDLLSALCLARDCPLMIAPAMNKQMWENPATQRNVSQLIADGIVILGPDSGDQACGENGMGRMLEPEDLCTLVNATLTPKLLKGKKILITAGATQEAIDPVRVITNLSSGKMGVALARIAADMGAEVTLVHGKIENMAWLGANIHAVPSLSAEGMYQAVMTHIPNQDIFISVAAVADYSPAKPSAQKIKKLESSLTLELKRNKDILADVASLPNAPFCVGFAAETQDMLKHAEQKRIAKKLPLMVANDAVTTFGNDENEVILLDDNGTHALAKSSKTIVAGLILRHIANML